MHIGRALLVALVATAPFSIELHEQGDTLATVTAADGTQFEVMAGTGTYAFLSRGCNGEILRSNPVSFRDAAVRVQAPLAGSGVALGVRAGVVRDDFAGGNGFVTEPIIPPPGPEPPRVISTNRYVNPYLTFSPPGGSVGIGYVWHDHEFPTAGEGARQLAAHPLNDLSAHVRIGSESRYFETRWMEGVPLYSDGGYLSIGGGGRPGGGPFTFFTGLGAGGPYEGAGLALRMGFDVGAGWNVGMRSRLGKSGNADASGIAIGVNYTGRRR